jgi:hypothetical protein
MEVIFRKSSEKFFNPNLSDNQNLNNYVSKFLLYDSDFDNSFNVSLTIPPKSFTGDKIVVTACNDLYIESCVTLISSIHKFSKDVVDHIIVYDLGLSDECKRFLNTLYKVILIEITDIKNDLLDPSFYQNGFDSPDEYLVPNQFAWKLLVMLDSRRFGKYILYLDSGVMTCGPLDHAYTRLLYSGSIFTADHDNLNKNWISASCRSILNVTEDELSRPQINANVIGFNTDCDIVMNFLNEAFQYTKIKECVHGDHYYTNVFDDIRGHRHDQSIMSVLINRYPIRRINKIGFLDWRSVYDLFESKALFYCHHRMIRKVDSLLFK